MPVQADAAVFLLGWLLQDALCISVVVGAEGLFQGGKRAASDLPSDGEDPPGGLYVAPR